MDSGLKRLLHGIVILFGSRLVSAQTAQYPFQNPDLPTEQRVSDLLSRMSLEEKFAALSTDPSVPRLGVRGTGHVEGLHGLALGGPGHWEGHRGQSVIPTTQFPQSRGLGQTWDPALLEQAAAVEGYETRYALQSSKYKRGGLVVRAPNADLSRDPRWGRSEESYGEDPFLTGTLAVAFVKGLQGDDPKYWLTASLMKHFLANSNEDGRGGSSSNFDERLFHEYYAVPFRMGIEEGHSDAFMTAYNAWNHIPMAANPVLKNVVMKDWGFNGIICTDAGALTNMVTEHKAFATLDEAAAAAIHAGINQFLDKYLDAVRGAYQKQLITEAEIDENLRGVYRVMTRLGMLDPAADVPYTKIGGTADPNAVKGDPWTWPEHRELARKLTDESIVLLKNQNRTLPLDASKIKSIAVIGPYADQVLLDWYSGTPTYSVSPLEGIRKRAGGEVKVSFSKGQDAAEVRQLAANSDVVIAVIGNHPTCDAGWAKCPLPSDGKEAVDRKSITLQQEEIVKEAFAANPRTIVAMLANFPFAINWTEANIPAIVEMTHNSEEEGTGLADVLFGDYNPAGRLTQTWPASLDQVPPMMDYEITHGRTYMYFKGKPLYAFGYGLSYTSFKYSGLKLSTKRIRTGDDVIAKLDVENTGEREGDEVVQLYASYPESKVTRPQQQLVAFRRIRMKPHERKTVELTIKAAQFAYWADAKRGWTMEAGPVRLAAGGSSDDLKLNATAQVGPE